MAEALAASGLASSIVSFIDFSVKLAKLIKDFYDAHGELPKDLRKCQGLVDEFSGWIRDLQVRQTNKMTVPTKAEAALQGAVDRCASECQNLIRIYTDLIPMNGQASVVRGRISDFKLALKAMRTDERIKRAQQSLECCKNDLRLCIAERTLSIAEETRLELAPSWVR